MIEFKDERIYTSSQVSQITQHSQTSIRNWINNGLKPTIKDGDKVYKIRVYLKARKVGRYLIQGADLNEFMEKAGLK